MEKQKSYDVGIKADNGGKAVTRRKISTQDMVLCGVFTTLIAVGAFIKVPVPVVPFTLQFLFTMMAGLLLGGRKGALSVGVYILLGLVGLPVFAEGGGFWYILKPSFGYLLGFMLAAYVTGTMVEKEAFDRVGNCGELSWPVHRLCCRHDLLLCNLQLCD